MTTCFALAVSEDTPSVMNFLASPTLLATALPIAFDLSTSFLLRPTMSSHLFLAASERLAYCFFAQSPTIPKAFSALLARSSFSLLASSILSSIKPRIPPLFFGGSGALAGLTLGLPSGPNSRASSTRSSAPDVGFLGLPSASTSVPFFLDPSGSSGFFFFFFLLSLSSGKRASRMPPNKANGLNTSINPATPVRISPSPVILSMRPESEPVSFCQPSQTFITLPLTKLKIFPKTHLAFSNVSKNFSLFSSSVSISNAPRAAKTPTIIPNHPAKGPRMGAKTCMSPSLNFFRMISRRPNFLSFLLPLLLPDFFSLDVAFSCLASAAASLCSLNCLLLSC